MARHVLKWPRARSEDIRGGMVTLLVFVGMGDWGSSASIFCFVLATSSTGLGEKKKRDSWPQATHSMIGSEGGPSFEPNVLKCA